MKHKNDSIAMEPIKTDPSPSDESAFLLDAIQKANDAYMYHRDDFDNAEQSLRYIFGDQYSSEDLNEAYSMNRVAMTFNMLPQFINKVTGTQRANTNTIDVVHTGTSITDEAKMKTIDEDTKTVSEVYTDFIRHIEYESNAETWYKMAFKQSLEGGFGYLRVLTDYESFGFDQEIKISGIRNRWSVLIDPAAQESDMSDMNFCFINESMPRKEFEKRYPGKSYDAMPGSSEAVGNNFWQEEDMVTVSEYFWREPIKKTLVMTNNGNVHEYEDIEPDLEMMASQGIEVVRMRDIQSYRVMWAKISQGDILEKARVFPTTTIPVVPMLGREFSFRDERRYRGLVDDAIDAQIGVNKMKSAAIERVDGSPLAPFIATDKSIEGKEGMWAEANSARYAVLTYKKGEERPTREMGTVDIRGQSEISNELENSMKASTGLYNSSLGEKSNEKSGVAIAEKRSEAEAGTYEFLDNYNNAIRRVGLLVAELIPTVYDTQRVIQLRTADGNTEKMQINQPNGANPMIKQKVNVHITSGKSYDSKRQENADQILELMKINPQVAEVGADLLVRNLDFAESDVLANRLEKMVPEQFLTPEQKEERKEEATPPEPTPEEKIAQLELETKTAELEAKQKEAEISLEIEKIKLETAQVNLKSKEIDAKQKNVNQMEKNNSDRIKARDDGLKRNDEALKRRADMVTSVIDQAQPKQDAK